MGCYRAKHTHDMDESAWGFSDSHMSSYISRRGSRVPVHEALQGLIMGSRGPPVGAPAGQLHVHQSPEAGSLHGAELRLGPVAINSRGYSRPEKGETWQCSKDAHAVSVLPPQKQGHQMLLVPCQPHRKPAQPSPHIQAWGTPL